MILEMIVNRVSSPIRYKSQEWFGPPWFQSYFLLAGRSRLLEINFSPLAPINQSFLDFDVGPLVDGEQSQTLGKLIVPSVFLFCSTGIIFEFLAPISTRLLTTPTIVINCNHVWKYTFFLISLFRNNFFQNNWRRYIDKYVLIIVCFEAKLRFQKILHNNGYHTS